MVLWLWSHLSSNFVSPQDVVWCHDGVGWVVGLSNVRDLLQPNPFSDQQDPRSPVESLLHADRPGPWLSCPKEHSRQLRVELQLERASPVGCVGIGGWAPRRAEPWAGLGVAPIPCSLFACRELWLCLCPAEVGASSGPWAKPTSASCQRGLGDSSRSQAGPELLQGLDGQGR